ncbi:GNAT family N-acetyltransferase [Humibacter sp.]|uniref:GNAT family N-acetyltransferase n=1 Tax=Humibacter sp. TaxID=1940291 RepID=UPI003F7E97EB
MDWNVIEVEVAETYALRREMLRRDRIDLELHLPDDDVPGAFHLAATDASGAVVCVVSVMPSSPRFAAPGPAWRLRQMAVSPELQGSGVGTALFDGVLDRVRGRGAATLWAESRDTSLGFYVGRGMQPVPGHHHTVAGVDYTDVALDIGEALRHSEQDASA